MISSGEVVPCFGLVVSGSEAVDTSSAMAVGPREPVTDQYIEPKHRALPNRGPCGEQDSLPPRLLDGRAALTLQIRPRPAGSTMPRRRQKTGEMARRPRTPGKTTPPTKEPCRWQEAPNPHEEGHGSPFPRPRSPLHGPRVVDREVGISRSWARWTTPRGSAGSAGVRGYPPMRAPLN